MTGKGVKAKIIGTAVGAGLSGGLSYYLQTKDRDGRSDKGKKRNKFSFSDIDINFGRGKDKKKRKSFWYKSSPYIIPAVAGGLGSLAGRNPKERLIGGLGSAALASGLMIGAGKLDEANNSGKIRDWGSKVGLNNYKKKKRK